MATPLSSRSTASPLPAEPAGRVLWLPPAPSLLKDTKLLLENQRFTIFAVKSTGEALDEIRSVPPIDLVVLDCEQGQPGPLEWMEQLQLRQLENTNGPELLLLCAPEQLAMAMEAVQQGAHTCLVKPFTGEQLLLAVRRAVEYRRLKLQNNSFRHHLEQMIGTRTRMLQHTMQQLEQSYDITLEALGDALDLKDAETEGHSKRVTAYTLALGRAVGLTEPQLRVVGRGAFLHDIGKMAIPDAILRKPGKLTEEERAVMRTHSELGYRMIRKIPYLREAAEIVYAHQECYDGSGYPRGLRGEQIHIGARIFALADTLDAITSNRPYRKAATIAEARREMLRCAGTQFDPAIVDVFVATPDSIWLNLREGIMRDGAAFSPFGYTFGNVPAEPETPAVRPRTQPAE